MPSNDAGDLFDLIWLGERAVGLEVQNFRHCRLRKYLVTPLDTLEEPERQERSQTIKPDVSVCRTLPHL